MSLETRVKEMLLDVATDYNTFRIWITGTSVGTLANLLTTDKTSLIAAINEVFQKADTATVPTATTAVEGKVRLASLSEMAIGADGAAVATVAGVRQERVALKAELLGGADPTWDTIQELKLLVDEAEESDQIVNLTTLVGQKVNADDVYTKAEIGNSDADFAAYYQAAKA
jgi:hypothetical protein